MCAREQAKAWALREAWLAEGKGKYGMFALIAQRVRRTSGGMPTGSHPTSESIAEFFGKIDGDAEWYPGKQKDTPRGPKRVLAGHKKGALIQAAKRIKREGGEVTYSAMVSACPAALTNPATGEPVSKKCLYTVFREDIYDNPEDPEDTWDHRARLSRSALDDDQIDRRREWAEYILGLRRTAAWFFSNVVWCDLCSSILPRTQRKASEQARARKAGKGWGSKCSQQHSATLRAPKGALKMKSTDTIKVWFLPVLARGKFHLELFPADFPCETEAGAHIMVAKVRAILNVRFPAGDAPRTLFTDRGNGFYVPYSGRITDGYRTALRDHGLKSFMGPDASVQPGCLQELMLHETAMAWVRERLKKTVPRSPWDESVDAYGRRLKGVAEYINRHYNVDGLCRELLDRVAMLLQAGGDRIPK